MLRIRKYILCSVCIVVCFLNRYNVSKGDSSVLQKTDTFKLYPINYKYRTISNNFSSSFSFTPSDGILSYNGILGNLFYIASTENLFYYTIAFLHLALFDLPSICFFKESWAKIIFNISQYRELLLGILKPLISKSNEYILFSWGNFRCLYIYAFLDFGYCCSKTYTNYGILPLLEYLSYRWLPCKIEGENFTYSYGVDGKRRVIEENVKDLGQCPICLNEFSELKKEDFKGLLHFTHTSVPVAGGKEPIASKISKELCKSSINEDAESISDIIKKIDTDYNIKSANNAKTGEDVILDYVEKRSRPHVYCEHCIKEYLYAKYKMPGFEGVTFQRGEQKIECPQCRAKITAYKSYIACTMQQVLFYISLLQQLTFEYANHNKIYTYMDFLRVSFIFKPICYMTPFLLNDIECDKISNPELEGFVWEKYMQLANSANEGLDWDAVSYDTELYLGPREGTWTFKDFKETCRIQYLNWLDPFAVYGFTFGRKELIRCPHVIFRNILAIKINLGFSYKNYYFFTFYIQPTWPFKISVLDALYYKCTKDLYEDNSYVHIYGNNNDSDQEKNSKYVFMKIDKHTWYVEIGFEFYINARDENYIYTI